MDLSISQDTYNRYAKKSGVISNRRIRPENEGFIDALLSVDMVSTPDRKEAMNIIRNLN